MPAMFADFKESKNVANIGWSIQISHHMVPKKLYFHRHALRSIIGLMLGTALVADVAQLWVVGISERNEKRMLTALEKL